MAKKPLHIIYVPGLGDKAGAKTLRWQQRAVQGWHGKNVTSEVLPMNWADADEAWSAKLERLSLAIDVAWGSGKAIGLVGASAGALPVITAYASHLDEVVGVVVIAGKVNRPEAVGDRYKIPNPALMPALASCQLALSRLEPEERARIMSRRALIDEVVTKADSYIPGASNRVVFSIGHVITIALQITIGAPAIIRFLKRQRKAL